MGEGASTITRLGRGAVVSIRVVPPIQPVHARRVKVHEEGGWVMQLVVRDTPGVRVKVRVRVVRDTPRVVRVKVRARVSVNVKVKVRIEARPPLVSLVPFPDGIAGEVAVPHGPAKRHDDH